MHVVEDVGADVGVLAHDFFQAVIRIGEILHIALGAFAASAPHGGDSAVADERHGVFAGEGVRAQGQHAVFVLEQGNGFFGDFQGVSVGDVIQAGGHVFFIVAVHADGIGAAGLSKAQTGFFVDLHQVQIAGHAIGVQGIAGGFVHAVHIHKAQGHVQQGIVLHALGVALGNIRAQGQGEFLVSAPVRNHRAFPFPQIAQGVALNVSIGGNIVAFKCLFGIHLVHHLHPVVGAHDGSQIGFLGGGFEGIEIGGVHGLLIHHQHQLGIAVGGIRADVLGHGDGAVFLDTLGLGHGETGGEVIVFAEGILGACPEGCTGQVMLGAKLPAGANGEVFDSVDHTIQIGHLLAPGHGGEQLVRRVGGFHVRADARRAVMQAAFRNAQPGNARHVTHAVAVFRIAVHGHHVDLLIEGHGGNQSVQNLFQFLVGNVIHHFLGIGIRESGLAAAERFALGQRQHFITDFAGHLAIHRTADAAFAGCDDCLGVFVRLSIGKFGQGNGAGHCQQEAEKQCKDSFHRDALLQE